MSKTKIPRENQIRKQLSISLPISDWKAIRNEAARLRIPMTELCRGWMKDELDQLRQNDQLEIVSS